MGFIGEEGKARLQPFEILPGVEQVMPVLAPYKLVSKEFKPESTQVEVSGGVVIGGKKISIIAGPCSIESREQMSSAADSVKKIGANILRGGAFKPRTSPYSFQG